MKRITSISSLICLLLLAASLGSRAQAPFSYTFGGSCPLHSPDASYTVGAGNTSNVTVTFNATIHVTNTDGVNSHTANFDTSAESLLRNSTTLAIVFDVTHTTPKGNVTIAAGDSVDWTDSSTGSQDIGVGSYSFQGWSGVADNTNSYGSYNVRASGGISVR